MNIFIIFSCFFSLLMGSNMALTCWDSDGYQTVSEYNMNVSFCRNTSKTTIMLFIGGLSSGVSQLCEHIMLSKVLQSGHLGTLLRHLRMLRSATKTHNCREEGLYLSQVSIIFLCHTLFFQGSRGDYYEYFCNENYCNSCSELYCSSSGTFRPMLLLTTIVLLFNFQIYNMQSRMQCVALPWVAIGFY